jgi:hypothetical protein
MESLNFFRIAELAAKQKGQWLVLVSNGFDYSEAWAESPVFLKLCEIEEKWGPRADSGRLTLVSEEYFFFGSEAEAFEFYEEFRRGPLADSEVYSCIVCPERGIVDENT